MKGRGRRERAPADNVAREIAEALCHVPDLSRCEEIRLDRHELEDPGIPFRVVLEDAVRAWRDPVSKHIVATSIPAVDSLVAHLAILRAHLPWKLRGDEIRFMRRVLEMSAKDFAKALGIKPETLSRCENGRQPLGEQTERLMRLYVVERLKDRAPGALIVPRDILEMGLRSVPEEPLSFACRAIYVQSSVGQPLRESWKLSEAA